jgi:hypothetical protein
MLELLFRVGQLILGFASMLGPLILLMLLLKLRDQRESTLYNVVLHELNSPELRGLYALDIRCGLLPWRNTVLMDMWNSSHKEIWDTTMRLSLSLPPKVRLVVNGTMDQKSRLGFAIKVKREAPSIQPTFCWR